MDYSLAISTLGRLILLTYIHHASFDNASHNDKPLRISHNSITLCHELQVMCICFFLI